MKTIQIPVFIDEFDPDELPPDIRELKARAEAAREQAYAPYSRFRVGAALLLDDGTVVTANNQENAAFPSGMCAERIAVWYAGARYPGRVMRKLFISARSETRTVDRPVPPCGACRQAIAEYEIKQNSPIEIWFAGETGKIWRSPSLENLLPLLFDRHML
ncbi:MAG: cytidine deaminase [Chlorobi bacterium]|nr:cytidine deaminase [Chlorobiota bacterium]